MKFAAKLSNRSVITTGLGSTSAGLTVTAVKDGGGFIIYFYVMICFQNFFSVGVTGVACAPKL